MIRKFGILWSKCQEFGVQNVRNLRPQIKLDNMHKHIISIFEPEIYKSLSIFEPEAQIKYAYKKNMYYFSVYQYWGNFVYTRN